MHNETGKARNNAVAVAASVVVAGIVGTLASALFGRSETKREVAQRRVAERLEQLETGAGQAIDKLVSAAEGLTIPHMPDSKRAQRKARAAGKSASKTADSALKTTKSRIAEIDREARKLQAIEKANKLGHEGSKRASELAHQLSSRTSELVDDNRSDVRKWKAKALRSASEVRDRGSKLADHAKDTAPEVRERASRAAHRAKDQAPGLLGKGKHLLNEAGEQGATYASQARDKGPELRNKASKAAHEVAEHARDLAPEVRAAATGLSHSAADRASHFVDQARDKGPDVLGAVGDHVADAFHSAQKQARPLMEEAASAASKAVEQAKDAGKHAAESVVPEIQHRADSVSDRMHLQGHSAVSSLGAIGSAATDKLANTTDAIELKSKSAASAAGRGTKETGALLAWTAAAAGLVYVTFLNDQQRQRVKESGLRIATEVKEVFRDLRGQDGEFPK